MALTRVLMQLRPIAASLRRHKVATLLIVLQVALTLAVASNALFIVVTRVVHVSRATGTDEAHLFAIRNAWTEGQGAAQIDANIRADLAALRQVPGVRDAFSSHAYPLEGEGALAAGMKLTPEQTTRPTLASIYHADEHAIGTFGTSLIAGRNFRADEIGTIGPNDTARPAVVIITRSLADRLFPEGAALGKTVYPSDKPATIIGILDNLQSTYSFTRTLDNDTVLFPARWVDPDGVVYLVRTQGADLKPVIAASLKALQERGGIRLIDPDTGVETIAQARERAYATDRSVATLLAIVCSLLLLATAGGIVGLSSFWVSQRRKQIGIRRSLGATSGDILRYFHAENFLIVTAGVVLGVGLAFLANVGLMSVFPLPAMPLFVPVLGALLLWLLGQLAVWGPARYAAKVSPVVAIRTA